MAYSDGTRKFWTVDLSTRAGARSAASQGGLACFVFSGMAVLGFVLLGGMAGYGSPQGLAILIGAGLELVVGVIAGLRLRAGKGAVWGIAVIVLLVAEGVSKIMALSFGGLIIIGFLMVTVINGVRGALALRRGLGFEDEDAEAFS